MANQNTCCQVLFGLWEMKYLKAKKEGKNTVQPNNCSWEARNHPRQRSCSPKGEADMGLNAWFKYYLKKFCTTYLTDINSKFAPFLRFGVVCKRTDLLALRSQPQQHSHLYITPCKQEYCYTFLELTHDKYPCDGKCRSESLQFVTKKKPQSHYITVLRSLLMLLLRFIVSQEWLLLLLLLSTVGGRNVGVERERTLLVGGPQGRTRKDWHLYI